MDNGHHSSNLSRTMSLTAPAEPVSPLEVTKEPFRTLVINDMPATEDSFTDGPHSRITRAILELLKNHNEAISIGLEGYWGSGKTTIVRLLEQGLTDENNKPQTGAVGTPAAPKEFALIVFDAWAHEGDPLRRIFLESLISQLQNKKEPWINRQKWKKQLEEIAKRKEVQKTILPPLTRLGKIVAILAFLVPLGTALVSGVAQKNIQLSLTPSFTPNDVTTTFFLWVGVLFTLAPLLVITGVVLRRRLLRKKKSASTRAQSASSSQEVSLDGPKGEPEDTAEETEDLWSLLFINRTEERVETVTTPHPTSLEFEKYFNELLDDALSEPQRHIVFVLDNLDRVEPDQALSIWSTLQIFMKQSQLEKGTWRSRIKMLVLYDPRGIRLLWDARRTSANGAEHQEVTPYFLDKSFQIRFEVPSPVLSDWRKYLIEKLTEAFFGRYRSEFHTIYQVMSLVSAQRGEIPTIRELKLYVNQIGAFHSQRGKADEIKLSHIAYFVLLRRQGVDVIAELKSKEGIPSPEFVQLLGTDLQESLAALAFNVERTKARQLLFGGPINKALAAGPGNTDELVELSKLDGFWEVLDSVVQEDWLKGKTSRLPIVATCLFQSGILKDKQEEAEIIIDMLTRSARKEEWDLLDEDKLQGIRSLAGLKRDPQLIEFLLDNAAGTIVKKGEPGVDVKSWVNRLTELCLEFCHGRIPESIFTFIRSNLVAGAIEDDKLSLLIEILIESRTTTSSYNLLRELVTKGHLLRHLEGRERKPTCRAWCLFTLLLYWEFGPYDQAALSRAVTFIQQPALAVDELLMREFAGLVARYSIGGRTYRDPFSRVLNTSGEPPVTMALRKACLKFLADAERSEELFTIDVINQCWPVISHDLRDDDPYPSALCRLVRQLIETDQSIDTVTRDDFSTEKAGLYELLIMQPGSHREKLLNLCRDGLQPLTKAEWLRDSAKDAALFRLALELRKHGVDLSLGQDYVEALISFFGMIAEGEPPTVPESYRYLPDLVSDDHAPSRDLLRKYFKDDTNNLVDEPPASTSAEL